MKQVYLVTISKDGKIETKIVESASLMQLDTILRTTQKYKVQEIINVLLVKRKDDLN